MIIKMQVKDAHLTLSRTGQVVYILIEGGSDGGVNKSFSATAREAKELSEALNLLWACSQ